MNNEENKILDEAAEEQNSVQAEGKKKLSNAALIGIIVGVLAVIAIVVVLVVVLGGGKCKNHVDINDDFLCDNCGEDFNDGLEVVTENVTFLVKMDNGQALADVGFILTKGEEEIRLVSDENGRVTHTLAVGKYSIDYDYGTILATFSADTYSVKVEQGMGEVVLVLTDNTPDGSAEKPFYIMENETEITIEPRAEIHYTYRGAVTKYLTINSDKLIVVYDGVEYTAVNGVIEVTVTPKEIGVSTEFVIKNISDATVNEVMSFLAPLGSMDNPYVDIDEDGGSHTVPAEGTIYYQWTATDDGMLVVRVEDSANNSIGLTRILENDVPISSQTADNDYVYMPVCKDDVITITVSTKNTEDTKVEFSVALYGGDESDPVDILIDQLDISFTQGQSITFEADAGSKVVISGEANVSVSYNGTVYTPDDKGNISFTVVSGCTVFTVTNTAENINSIVMDIED